MSTVAEGARPCCSAAMARSSPIVIASFSSVQFSAFARPFSRRLVGGGGGGVRVGVVAVVAVVVVVVVAVVVDLKSTHRMGMFGVDAVSTSSLLGALARIGFCLFFSHIF